MRRFRLTSTAAAQFEKIGRDTAAKWGNDQARRYLIELRDGFETIAARHDRLPPKPAGVGDLRLHRVNRHYVVFLPLTEEVVAIVAILHERMDVPARLREMQGRLTSDIEAM